MTPYYEDETLKIFCGDYLSVLPFLTKNSVDCIITDPPYGINYQNNYTHNVKNKLIGDIEEFSYTKLAKESWRLLKENTAIFAYTGWSTYPKHFFDIKQEGFKMKEPIIVQKRPSGTTDLYGSFQTNSDWIIFAHKGRFKFKQTQLLRNKKAGTIPNVGRKPVSEYKTRLPSCWFGQEYPWSTENPSSVSKYNHPTIKNIEMIKWLILLSTNENNLVVDPFMGSGTTLIAAKMTNRQAIGIEINEEFCKIAVKRLQYGYYK